ncbi:MAG: alpha/beta hydrolase [Gammaproteobacteria bacterium]|nr:alpha/beta hydrolase [Gammaproteobacteria bacterium]
MTHHPAITKEALSINGPAGVLEALLEIPEAAGFRRIAVICHPHPLHHGSMLNKVVHTVALAMMDLGAPVLRFNFRGVGASEGSYDEGIGESEDALAACAWLRSRYPGSELTLAGFSFGATVACRAAVTAQPARLVAIAPPPDRARALLGGRHPGCPWLVVVGDADGVVAADEVEAWVGELHPRPDFELLPGVDHFFHGSLTQLRRTIVRHLGA